MGDDVERLHAHIPLDLKEKLKSGDGSQRDQVVEALEIYFGEENAGNREAINRQINRFKEQKARGEQLIQQGEEMKREAEAGIERLQSRLDSIEQTKLGYDQELKNLLVTIDEESMAVFEGHARVQSIANAHDKAPVKVLNDLREQSDLNDSYFEPGEVETKRRRRRRSRGDSDD